MPRRPTPPFDLTLWDSLPPPPPLAAPDAPGLMGHLRSKVQLPPTPLDFGIPKMSLIRTSVRDRQRPRNDPYYCTSREQARRIIEDYRRNGYPEDRFYIVTETEWGIPPNNEEWRIMYLVGPHAGAFAQTPDQPPQIAWQPSFSDALYFAANHLPAEWRPVPVRIDPT